MSYEREESRQIKYTSGYKYMLEEDAWFYTGLPVKMITKRVEHYSCGWMLVREGFGWDGASALAIDTKDNMRAAMVHDALYYLHRRGLPLEYRHVGDEKLEKLMIQDGACKLRARYYRWAVSNFGKGSAEPRNLREILMAP